MSPMLTNFTRNSQQRQTTQRSLQQKKRRLPVRQVRADVTCATTADEAADVEGSMFESRPFQSTAAVSCAGQVETTNKESTYESQHDVYHAAVESKPEASKADVTSTIEVEMATESDGSRTSNNTDYNPLHKTTTKAGALVTSTILPGWKATRVSPGQYPQYTRATKNGGRLWVAHAQARVALHPGRLVEVTRAPARACVVNVVLKVGGRFVVLRCLSSRIYFFFRIFIFFFFHFFIFPFFHDFFFFFFFLFFHFFIFSFFHFFVLSFFFLHFLLWSPCVPDIHGLAHIPDQRKLHTSFSTSSHASMALTVKAQAQKHIEHQTFVVCFPYHGSGACVWLSNWTRIPVKRD